VIFLSKRFINQALPYAELEARLNRDYTEQIVGFAVQEVDRLTADGVPFPQAKDAVQNWLDLRVTRFPAVLPEGQL
jgi:hypothetical protein